MGPVNSVYKIPLTEFGRKMFGKRDRHVERAVEYLVNRIGVQSWALRREVIVKNLITKLSPNPEVTPIEGVSLRERTDEIGWYLFLAETSIGDPISVEGDQASRVLPYLQSFGRNLDAILQIKDVESRIDSLLRRVSDQDPDQALYELLVGAAYANEGWSVCAVKESSRKTPDFLIQKDGFSYDLECKRFSRRPEYSERERDAWLRLWQPVSIWLHQRRLSLVLRVSFHVEVHTLPKNYLVDFFRRNELRLASGFDIEDSGRCTVKTRPVDLAGISSTLKANWVKCNSSRERELITGQHEKALGLTYAIQGHQVQMGESSTNTNLYWERISYVQAAFWECLSPEAVKAKARNIIKRLSEATGQLSKSRPGVVHIGIETAEGEAVELARAMKIEDSLSRFNTNGKPLHWICLNFFLGEATPDGLWAFDETCYWKGIGTTGGQKPLEHSFVVLPKGGDTRPGVHWEAPS